MLVEPSYQEKFTWKCIVLIIECASIHENAYRDALAIQMHTTYFSIPCTNPFYLETAV